MKMIILICFLFIFVHPPEDKVNQKAVYSFMNTVVWGKPLQPLKKKFKREHYIITDSLLKTNSESILEIDDSLISKEDKEWMISQTKRTGLDLWDQKKLHRRYHVEKTTEMNYYNDDHWSSFEKKFREGEFLSFSLPLFSRDSSVVLIFFHGESASNSVEFSCICHKDHGKWIKFVSYLTSIGCKGF
jgi:hypothetical protein